MAGSIDARLAILANGIYSILASSARLADEFGTVWRAPTEEQAPWEVEDDRVTEQALEIVTESDLELRLTEGLGDEITGRSLEYARPLAAVAKETQGVEVFYLAAVLIGTAELERVAAQLHVDLASLNLSELRRKFREHLQRHHGLDPASLVFRTHAAVVAAEQFTAWLSGRLSEEL